MLLLKNHHPFKDAESEAGTSVIVFKLGESKWGIDVQFPVFNVLLSYLYIERFALVYGLNKVKSNHRDEKESRHRPEP